MKNLVNFHQTTQKSENFTSMGSFCPKYIRLELKQYRKVIHYNTEQWCKIWINLDLVVSKMTSGNGWTFIRALKNCTLMGSFCPKHIIFSLNISEILCVMTLKRDVKFKGKLTRGMKNDVRCLVNFQASSWKSGNLHFYGLLFAQII